MNDESTKIVDIQNAKYTAHYNINDAIFEFRVIFEEQLRENNKIISMYDFVKEIYDKFLFGSFPCITLRMYKSNVHFRDTRFNIKAYDRYKDSFINGELDEYQLIGYKENPRENMGGFGITCDPNRYTLSRNNLNGIVYKEPVHQMNADKIKRLCDLFIKLNEGFCIINSYICISNDTCVSFINPTSHELLGNNYTCRDIHTKLRGVFWANVINKNISDMLGGIENIKRESPFYSVSILGNCVYMQLTENIIECTVGDIIRLRDYLEQYNLLPMVSEYIRNQFKENRRIPGTIDGYIFYRDTK